ncbi:hypothetical protein NC651_020343 [Populus alba x Populus x berolinensis]|nr:hypothetical protein NC651_020343 [Populus alba x Populus x berolinensis]
MEAKWCVPVTMALLVMLVVVVSGDESSPVKTSVKMVKGEKVYLPVRKLVSETQHSFWDHHSSIAAAAAHQPLGSDTTVEGNLRGRRKLLLSLGMLAAKPHVSKRKINTD